MYFITPRFLYIATTQTLEIEMATIQSKIYTLLSFILYNKHL